MTLKGPQARSQKINILFRAGMSGNFLPKAEDDDFLKHAHLRFHFADSKAAICFVDPRRFGSWQVTDSWGDVEERGPDLQLELSDAIKNIQDNLENKLFDRPIGEVLLDQKFFNGIGNYLRAEILFRASISPFSCARTVLAENTTIESPLFSTCSAVLDESLDLLRKHGFDDDADRSKVFNNWLQCYTKLSSAVDSLGRRIWFSPAHARSAPRLRPTASTRRRKQAARAVPEDDGAVDPVEEGAEKDAKEMAEEEAALVTVKEEPGDVRRRGRGRGRKREAAGEASGPASSDAGLTPADMADSRPKRTRSSKATAAADALEPAEPAVPATSALPGPVRRKGKGKGKPEVPRALAAPVAVSSRTARATRRA